MADDLIREWGYKTCMDLICRVLRDIMYFGCLFTSITYTTPLGLDCLEIHKISV